MQNRLVSQAMIAFISLVLTSCTNGSVETEIKSDTTFNKVPIKFETSVILDTLWGGILFKVELVNYNDTTYNYLQITNNAVDTSTISLYDANQINDPDNTPITFFGENEVHPVSFIILSDTMAVLALRTMGMKRPELFIIVRDKNNKINLLNQSDQILTGQVTYVAFFEEQELFLLHESGVSEDEKSNKWYRNVATYTIINEKFAIQSRYQIPIGNELLYMEGDYNDHYDYYLNVYNQFIRP